MNHPMNGRWWWLPCAAAALLVGDVTWSRSPGCADVHFSAQVLSRFPRAPEACLDVISRDGQKYGVFKAQLDEVRGNTLRLRFKLPDGTRATPVQITPKPGARVLIDGRPTDFRDLQPGQELTAYVRVDQAVVALAPADADQSLQFVPLPESKREPIAAASAPGPAMPDTASSVTTIGWAGQLFLFGAIGLALLRRMRS